MEEVEVRASKTYGNMINPDHISVIKSDSITTPDISFVDIGNSNVLNDNIRSTADNSQTPSLDDTSAALTNDSLIRGDSDAEHTGFVVGGSGGGRIGLVVLAPVVLVNGDLACGGGAPGQTAGGGFGAFGIGEVKGLVEDDDAGGGVAEVRD